jgi:hypothetical protein
MFVEVARVLGFLAAISLVAAVAAWMKPFRGPQLQRLDGRAPPDVSDLEIASLLLLLAAALSAVAAILAVMGWISP